MDRVLNSGLLTAGKHYPCDACAIWNRAGMSLNDCITKEQQLIVEAAEADRFRILPGQKYQKVVGIFEGQFTTYRARPGMNTVIEQLGLTDG